MLKSGETNEIKRNPINRGEAEEKIVELCNSFSYTLQHDKVD